MRAWDSDVEEEDEGAEKETTYGAAETVDGVGKGDGEKTQHHLQKVQRLIYAAKVFGHLMTLHFEGRVQITYFIILPFHWTTYQPPCCVFS